jgi:hypothetical protein
MVAITSSPQQPVGFEHIPGGGDAMRQVMGPIWGRCRLTSSPNTQRECRRMSATTTSQQISAHSKSNMLRRTVRRSHYRDSMPILGNGPGWVTAAPQCGPVDLADLGVIRSVERSTFAKSICRGISGNRTSSSALLMLDRHLTTYADGTQRTATETKSHANRGDAWHQTISAANAEGPRQGRL